MLLEFEVDFWVVVLKLSETNFSDHILVEIMASILIVSKNKEESKALKVSNVELVRNEVCMPLKLKWYPKIWVKGNSSGALSLIMLKVILIHDFQSWHM